MLDLWDILLISMVFLCLCMSTVALLFLSRTRTQLMQSIGLINELHKSNQTLESRCNRLQDEVAHFEKMLLTQTNTIESFEHKLLQCNDKVVQLTEQDPNLKMYAKASKLVAAGEAIEDIIEATGLPRAEIDVLYALHRKT